jgi:hypothetical protein
MSQRYRFVQDDDCHWYMIPADKLQAFYDWEEGMLAEEEAFGMGTDYTYDGERFDKYVTGGGIAHITFENPKENE